MNILLFLLTLVIIFFIKKSLEEKIEEKMDQETATVAFSIDFNYKNLMIHPFTQNKIIPFLREKKYPQKVLDKEMQKMKDEFEESKKKYPLLHKNEEEISNRELEDIFWSRTIHDMIQTAIKDEGRGSTINFRIFNAGSGSNRYVWDGLYRGFSTEEPSFYLNMYLDKVSAMGDYIRLAGKKRFIKKNGEHYFTFTVYLSLHPKFDFKKKEDEDKEKENHTILLELPYDLISAYRYKLASKKGYLDKLYNIFNLKVFEGIYSGDVYQDELGDFERNKLAGYTIGNDYVKVWIR